MAEYCLPTSEILPPPRKKADDNRRNEILEELIESQANKIILIGQDPIRYFLYYLSDCKYRRLVDFGETVETYGHKHNIIISEKKYTVICFAHPRQIGGIGKHSGKWRKLHQQWLNMIMNFE
jgi:hypothetical protein